VHVGVGGLLGVHGGGGGNKLWVCEHECSSVGVWLCVCMRVGVCLYVCVSV